MLRLVERQENWDAGEYGQWNFSHIGYVRPRFLLLPFSSLRRLALETISSPFPVLVNSVLNKRKKTTFSSVIISRGHLLFQNSFSIEY